MEWSEKSQLSITSENDFRALFYADPVFAEVRGREGCPFQLESFELANARELLVLPREKSSFIADRISSS
jgi:hypothetical protein